MKVKTINEIIIDHQLIDNVKQELNSLGWNDGDIVEQLEELEQNTDRIEITIAEKNRLINLQRALYAKGFEDTLSDNIDLVLLNHSDEYQVGNINAHTFRKQFIKDVEKMYPYVDSAVELTKEQFDNDIFKRAAEIWKKSEASPSLIKKLTEEEKSPVKQFHKEVVDNYKTFIEEIEADNDKIKTDIEIKAREDRIKEIRSK